MTKEERIRKYGEVFTPHKTVVDMCDMLEEETLMDAFAPERTFLEPTCGDGAFILEILRRKFKRCKCRHDYTIALKSVYGLEIQPDNVIACIENVKQLCLEYFKPTKAEYEIINDHIIMCDALKIMKMMSDEQLQS